MDLGANINALPALFNSRTALEAAAERRRLDMILFLVKNGAQLLGSGERRFARAVNLRRSVTCQLWSYWIIVTPTHLWPLVVEVCLLSNTCARLPVRYDSCEIKHLHGPKLCLQSKVHYSTTHDRPFVWVDVSKTISTFIHWVQLLIASAGKCRSRPEPNINHLFVKADSQNPPQRDMDFHAPCTESSHHYNQIKRNVPPQVPVSAFETADTLALGQINGKLGAVSFFLLWQTSLSSRKRDDVYWRGL